MAFVDMRRLRSTMPWACVVGVLGFLVLAPVDAMREDAAATQARRLARLKHGIATNQQVVALFTFDDAASRNWITEAEGLPSGTVRVPGRFGSARKFDGRDRTSIDWPVQWRQLGRNYTIALWVKVDRRLPSQDILYSAGEGRRTGFRLVDGALTFDVPARERQCVAYPFERYGEFVHVAATVDAEAGTVVLYENGRERVRGNIESVVWPASANVAAGKPIWYAPGSPFRGVIDDTVLWRRTLTASEVRDLAAARRGVLETLSPPSLYAKWRWAVAQGVVLEGVARMADLVNLRHLRWRVRHEHELPEIRLVMSGRDRRHFIEAHHHSRLSGRRTQAAANPRRVHVAFKGRAYPATLHLSGRDSAYADQVRPGYVLDLGGEARIAGCRRLLLQPPESAGFLTPFVTSRLSRQFGRPALADGLCVLRINGVFQGAYRYVDHWHHGVLPGDFPGVADGNVRHVNEWRSLFQARKESAASSRASTTTWPLDRADLLAVYDAAAADLGPILLTDPHSPLRVSEIRDHLRRDRERAGDHWRCAPPDQSDARRALAFIDAFMLLGNNPSSYRLVDDLALRDLRIPGVTLSWSSSDPTVLRGDGRVTRPASGGPVGVTLTVVAADATGMYTNTLPFRVMPATLALPALFLYLDEVVTKSRGVDAVLEICEAGEARPSATLQATQGTRGGVHHRGNSSYWMPKKLLSIETDAPHRLFGDDAQCMLKTINALQDPSFVRNGLAYGLFRAFVMDGAKRVAPFVRPAELFVNGRYHGLFELCTPVDEFLLGLDGEGDIEAPVSPPAVVYRHTTVRPRDRPMRATHPSSREGDLLAPYRELAVAIAVPDARQRVETLQRRVDLDRMMDLQLLLNFMQNENGAPYEFLSHDVLVYSGGADGMFYHVPWDFDYGLSAGWSWIANGMMRELETGMPDYKAKLARRWFALREEVLTPEAVLARLETLSAPLEGYVEWDQQRWPRYEPRPHAEYVEEVRQALLRNLAHMDHHLVAWRDDP